MSKTARLFLALLPTLALVSCGSMANSSYSAPSPLTVTFYDDSPEPEPVGYAYVLTGQRANPNFSSSGYDFLSNDPDVVLADGEHQVFKSWVGYYDEAKQKPIDLNSIQEDCSVYATFAVEKYGLRFLFHNGGNYIPSEEDPTVPLVARMLWGEENVEMPLLPKIEKYQPDFLLDYLFDGWTVSGHDGFGLLKSDLSNLCFADYDEAAAGEPLTLYLDSSSLLANGEREYPVYIYEGGSYLSIGSLSEGLTVDLDSHFAESYKSFEATFVFNGESKTISIPAHGRLSVSREIDDASNYVLSFRAGGESASYSLPVFENVGKELAFEAVYDEDAAPHLRGNPVDLENIIGPFTVNVAAKETTHALYFYDNDLDGRLLETVDLPSGALVTASLTRPGTDEEGSFTVSYDGIPSKFSYRFAASEHITSLEPAFQGADPDGYPVLEASENSFYLLQDASVYLDMDGDWTLNCYNGTEIDGVPESTLSILETTRVVMPDPVFDAEKGGYRSNVTIGLHTASLLYRSDDPSLSLTLVSSDDPISKTRSIRFAIAA